MDASREPRTRGHHQLGGLLVLILVSLSVQLAVPDTGGWRLVIVALQGATLLGALWVSGARPALIRVAAVAVALGLLTAAGTVAAGGDLGSTPAKLVTLLLVAFAPLAIAAGLRRDVAEEGGVTLRTMFGVLCIYLLIGMFFAVGFNVIQELSDEPFFSRGVEGETSDFLYYSYITLTTTGFGDLTAGTDLGRSLSVIEALIGQIYLVTVVALIVANLRPSRREA